MELDLDLNLLLILDALLDQESVSDAALQLNRSSSSVSRALSRIRFLFDDPILVRSGHGLVPTPRALELRDRVRSVIREVQSITQPREDVNLKEVSRRCTIAVSDTAMCYMGNALLQRLRREAPGIKASFVIQGTIDPSLRDSRVDMEVGVIRHPSVETRVELLCEDRIVGIARKNHPLFERPITLDVFVESSHLLHSNRGALWTEVDDRLAELGRERTTEASVPTLASSLFLLSQTDLVSTCLEKLTEPLAAKFDLRYFELPVKRSPAQISLAWHPRFEMDPVHSWLRSCISEIFSTGAQINDVAS